MNTVIIDRDPFEVTGASRSTFETDDVLGLIRRELPEWPTTARLYYESVAAERDITPNSEADIAAIGRLPEGTFHVVVYPGDPVSIAVNIIIAVLLSVAAYLLTPKQSAPSAPADRRIDDASPNNALSARTNQARPNGRIPDIFGEVRSTPDLLALPYTFFDDHKEFEHAFMCIGRGTYDVSSSGVRDGDTEASTIDGVSVEVYGPNTSPNSGTAQLTIGDAIDIDVATIGKSTAINGQLLRPTNSGEAHETSARFESTNTQLRSDGTDAFDDYFDAADAEKNRVTISGTTTFDNSSVRSRTGLDLTFRTPNIIDLNGGSITDFTSHFVVGETLDIANAANVTDGTLTTNLNGTGYTIATVTTTRITLTSPATINANWNSISGFNTGAGTDTSVDLSTPLISGTLAGTYDVTLVSDVLLRFSSPAAVNSDWNKLARIPNGRTGFQTVTVTPDFDRRIGPFTLADDQLTKVIVNVVALNGLYADTGTKQIRLNIGLEFQLRKIDADGNVLVDWETFTSNILGSATSRSLRAKTMTLTPAAGAGRYQIRGRQTSAYNYDFSGTIVDELKWRDCFTSSPISVSHFGDVTTVQALTKQTERSLAVKDRKLNLLVTRKIKQRQGSGFTSGLFAEKKFELILYHCALDPYIGRRSASELDLDQIDAIAADVRAYFGDDELAEFSYTFDKTGQSFEETAQAIAAVACCTPYRQGNQLRLAFERENDDSSLLFNHRNKVPKSEVRTYRFGTVKDFDGIELNYIDPEDDAIETYYIPTDRSATAPKKIDTIGVRSHKQAYVLAWREWNKLLYQREVTKFDALQEAELLVPNDRILVSDNTRPDTMDGEVVAQSSLTLTLSQEAELNTGATGYATFDAYTIHLQHIDGTVEPIGIKQGATTKEVLLENAPTVALSLDPQNSVRTGYVIIKADDPRTSAFIATEREAAKDRFVFPVTAINYDARYYAEDLNFPS